MAVSVAELLTALESRGMHLALGESLTGGLLSAVIVAVPGASKTLLGSVVAYDSALKVHLLGVDQHQIDALGPVSPQVAAQMAVGARDRMAAASGLDREMTIGVSTTGVAGPEAQGIAQVGEVFIGIAGFLGDVEDVRVYPHQFEGDRDSIRTQTVVAALEHIAAFIGL